MPEICSPITPHGFECHCEGRFRHIAPDALWTLLMLDAHTEVGSGNDIESRIPGRCENDPDRVKTLRHNSRKIC
jgi:hypothetical protein